jgi:DNA primase
LIADELISEIRDRTDIVALIGEYVDLKQRGQNWVGLCPFHNEKSPSFNVRRDRQFFHCFGCKESGDALGFLMRLEGLTFPQAARSLAEKLGIEIKEQSSGEDDQRRRDRARTERLCAVMEAATQFYLEQRSRHALSRFALEELAQREVDPATADTFRLGYAPHGWDALATHLQQKKHSLEDAELLGLCMKRRDQSGYYDRFRHRLVFPISDLQGNVVAFSGRILPAPDGREPEKDRQEPKYVNSPESPLYKKGEILYGLYESRVEIRRTGWAVVCEGNFDLVSLHRGGVHNVVAPLGTAFTDAQAKLLRRFAQRVTLMFDGDSAGRKAVHAAYPIVRKAELGARVVKLPQGDDPDAYLRRHGKQALERLVDSATGIVEYLIDTSAELAGPSAGERAAAIGALGPVIAASGNPVEIELYIQRISQRFAIDDQRAVREQLRRGVRAARPGGPPGAATQGPHQAVVSRPSDSQSGVPEGRQRVKVPPELEGRLVGALLDKPELFTTPLAGEVEELLTAAELQSIFSAAAAQVTQTGTINAPALVSALTGNPALLWLQERLSTETFADRTAAEQELRAGLEVLGRQKVIQHDLPKLRSEIQQAQQRGDTDSARELMKRHDELARARAKGLKR